MIKGLYNIFNHWHTEGTVWLISDTHFNDEELYVGTNRVERMDTEEYIKLINSKVGKKDTLIHLGDVGDLEVIRKLKGYKVLIMGNHDSGKSNYMRQLITNDYLADIYDRQSVLVDMKNKYPNHKITISGYVKIGAPSYNVYTGLADNGLFDEVYSGPLMIGEKLILSHEPVNVPWAFNIHGHVHSPNYKNDDHHLNICPENSGIFEPINLNRLMKDGVASKVETIHRDTIDRATRRKEKKGAKI